MELEFNIITKWVIAEGDQISVVPTSQMNLSDFRHTSTDPGPSDSTTEVPSVVVDENHEEFAPKVDSKAAQSVFTIRPSCEGAVIDTTGGDVTIGQNPDPEESPSREGTDRYLQTCSD